MNSYETFAPFNREDFYQYAGAEGQAEIFKPRENAHLNQLISTAYNCSVEECQVDFICDDSGLSMHVYTGGDSGYLFGVISNSKKISQYLKSFIVELVNNNEASDLADFCELHLA